MDGWMRPVFARRHTPTHYSDPTGFSIDDGHLKEDTLSKSKATSRVASRMGFLLGSPVPHTPKFPTPAPAPIIPTPDILYHKPSPDQMVETLKVVMMNQSSLDPVPIQYNSCILHALEAYYDLQVQLQRKSAELESLKQIHDRDIDDFDELTKAWSTKENDYQKEVKRLEVLLSRTDGGMEAVTIARSQSLVHGSRRVSEQINRGVGTVKERNGRSNQPDSAPLTIAARRRRASDRIHVHPPTQPIQPRVHTDHVVLEEPELTPDKASIATSGSSSSSAMTQPHESIPKSHHSDNWSLVPSWARATLGHHRNTERKRAKQESRASSGESTSDPNPPELKEPDPKKSSHGLRGIQNKPLPSIPSTVSERARQFIPKASSLSENDVQPHRTRHLPTLPAMGFSFRPGDDESILSPRLVEDELERPPSPKARGRTRWTDPERPGSRRREPNSETRGRKKQGTKPKSSSTGTTLPHIPSGEFRGLYTSLSREDSTSSVVTAVRDSSVQSTHRTLSITRAGRPRSERGVGNTIGEAVAAAAEALAKGERGLPGESVLTSAASRESSDVEGQVQGKEEKSTGSTSNVGGRQTGHHEATRKGS